MSFNVTLYSNFAKPDNSLRIPSEGTDFPCDVVEPCGIITPSISFAQGSAWNPSSYTYARIADWGRYYFIRDWTFTQGRWYAAMEVDALASFRSSILSREEYVTRSASQSDGTIVDNFYPATSQVTKGYSQTFVWEATGLSDGAYVIGVLGDNDTTTGGVAYFVTGANFLNNLMNHMLSDTGWIGTVPDISSELLKCLVNPTQYLTSVMWFPVVPWDDGGTSLVHAGWWSTGVGMPPCSRSSLNLGGLLGTVPNHPQSGRGSYLNKAPFTEIYAEILPFGRIALSPDIFPGGSDVRYSINIDPISGMGVLHIYNQQIEEGYMLQAKIGVDLSVGQSNASMLSAAGASLSSISSSLSESPVPYVMGGAALGGYAKTGVKGLTSDIGNALTVSHPQISTIGQNGGCALYQQPASLTTIFHHIVDEDNDHMGRPLCKKKTLSSLSGFVLTKDFDTNIPCTLAEKNLIKGYMDTGAFIE